MKEQDFFATIFKNQFPFVLNTDNKKLTKHINKEFIQQNDFFLDSLFLNRFIIIQKIKRPNHDLVILNCPKNPLYKFNLYIYSMDEKPTFQPSEKMHGGLFAAWFLGSKQLDNTEEYTWSCITKLNRLKFETQQDINENFKSLPHKYHKKVSIDKTFFRQKEYPSVKSLLFDKENPIALHQYFLLFTKTSSCCNLLSTLSTNELINWDCFFKKELKKISTQAEMLFDELLIDNVELDKNGHIILVNFENGKFQNKDKIIRGYFPLYGDCINKYV